MSALGHKQTFAAQNGMSALHPIATEKADSRKRPCLLCPRKRTCAMQLGTSALGHKRTSAYLFQDQVACGKQESKLKLPAAQSNVIRPAKTGTIEMSARARWPLAEGVT